MIISNQAIRDTGRVISGSLKELGGNLLGGYAWATALHVLKWNDFKNDNIFSNPLYAAQALALGNLFNIGSYGAGVAIDKTMARLFPIKETNMQKIAKIAKDHPILSLLGIGIGTVTSVNLAKRAIPQEMKQDK